VPVEVHDLKRLTRIPGLRQHLLQVLQRGRAKHHQVDVAAHRVQPL